MKYTKVRNIDGPIKEAYMETVCIEDRPIKDDWDAWQTVSGMEKTMIDALSMSNKAKYIMETQVRACKDIFANLKELMSDYLERKGTPLEGIQILLDGEEYDYYTHAIEFITHGEPFALHDKEFAEKLYLELAKEYAPVNMYTCGDYQIICIGDKGYKTLCENTEKQREKQQKKLQEIEMFLEIIRIHADT